MYVQCIFSVLLNGQPGSTFVPTLGLHQGDPLSSYLLLFVSDVLSRRIQLAVDHQWLEGIEMNQHAPVISHMFFADDTLIFLKATHRNCSHLVDILDQYCAASGQAVNLHKSSVFFGANIPTVISTKLGQLLHMHVVSDPGIYIGVPALSG